MKQVCFTCGCGDGSCDQCKAVLEMESAIQKTSVVTRDSQGNITSILSTRTVMDLKRLLKNRPNANVASEKSGKIEP